MDGPFDRGKYGIFFPPYIVYFFVLITGKPIFIILRAEALRGREWRWYPILPNTLSLPLILVVIVVSRKRSKVSTPRDGFPEINLVYVYRQYIGGDYDSMYAVPKSTG
jgi:hypothetical protein